MLKSRPTRLKVNNKERHEQYQSMQSEIDKYLRDRLKAFFSDEVAMEIVDNAWSAFVILNQWKQQRLELRNAFADILQKVQKKG